METLIDYLKSNKPRCFTPRPYYSVEGDSLVFYFEDKPSYAERVDDFLTIYKSIDTDNLIGCQIKGLPGALELLGNFGLHIEDKSVRLGMIFMACMAATPDAAAKQQYRRLAASIPRDELARALED